MRQAEIRTDWLGLLLSLVIPAAIVAGLVWTALQPGSWEQTPGWAWGLFMLLPLEGVRTWAARLTSMLYEEYTSAATAAMWFVGMFAFAFCFVLVMMLLPGRHGSSSFTPSEIAVALRDPWVLQVVLAPIVFIVAEGTLGLLLFRGDARVQSARVGAVAATSEFWFFAALVFPVGLGFVAIFVLRIVDASRITDIVFANSRTIVMLHAAFYFAGKALLLAYLHTARFAQSGRCLIPGEKQDVVDERRDALAVGGPTLRELMQGSRRTE